MKKIWLCLTILVLLAAGGCGESAPASTPGVSTAQGDAAVSASTPKASAAPSPAMTSDAEYVPEVIMLTVYEDGEFLCETTLEQEADRQVVMDAVMEAMLRSAAWPAVDMAEQQDYILIYVEYTNGAISEYYAFEMDGSCCLQGGDTGMYTTISEDRYAALIMLAEG